MRWGQLQSRGLVHFSADRRKHSGLISPENMDLTPPKHVGRKPLPLLLHMRWDTCDGNCLGIHLAANVYPDPTNSGTLTMLRMANSQQSARWPTASDLQGVRPEAVGRKGAEWAGGQSELRMRRLAQRAAAEIIGKKHRLVLQSGSSAESVQRGLPLCSARQRQKCRPLGCCDCSISSLGWADVHFFGFSCQADPA